MEVFGDEMTCVGTPPIYKSLGVGWCWKGATQCVGIGHDREVVGLGWAAFGQGGLVVKLEVITCYHS